jgi:aryl-alcohol dehydrogenase-like predicted oxidoreductase
VSHPRLLSEQIIGRWFAVRPRDVIERVVLARKGPVGGGQDVNSAGLSDASDMHTPVEKTLSFRDGAVKAGKIHHIGLSNFTGWQLQLIISTAKAMGVQFL